MHASPVQPAPPRALLRVGEPYDIWCTGRANRRTESTISPEIGFVPPNATAGIQVEIRAECLSPEIGFVPSNAFAGGASNRRRSVMKLTKRPQKTGRYPGSVDAG